MYLNAYELLQKILRVDIIFDILNVTAVWTLAI